MMAWLGRWRRPAEAGVTLGLVAAAGAVGQACGLEQARLLTGVLGLLHQSDSSLSVPRYQRRRIL